MDFELSKPQKDIRKAARKFAKGEFDREVIMELAAKHEFPFDICRKAAELGFIGMHFPEEYGGADYGSLENAIVVEEFCRADSSLGSATLLCDFAAETVLHFGTDEQKKRILIPIAEGKALYGGAFTEPDHGSDITEMATTAVRDGDEWVINGAKTFISNAGNAHHYTVLCQTDPEAGYRGQSMFIVPGDVPGVEATDLGLKMGIHLSPTGELTFKNVRVPADSLLGEEGRGFHQVLHFFEESRIEIAAQAVGIAQGAFDRALKYVKSRKQFGKRISDFQVTRHKLADMATKIELARLITYKAAWSFDRGKPDVMTSCMAKSYAARTAVEVSDEAVQLLGGCGYMADFDVERFFRDAKVTEIYEGTREIQKNAIAKAVIGK
jgi:alkylation response protein AidB-like acyl-CoA dehydrogenase